jgi:hypothetical protein
MDNYKVVEIPKGVVYLSEVMSELPKNCIFDKGMTGCGGSTIALTDGSPTVIAAPFTSLIENKCAQHKGVLGVFGGDKVVTDKEIIRYLKKTKIPKIMVTYDSIARVIKCIESIGESVDLYNLLIDEYHLLFTQYSFRNSAVKSVLENYTRFKSFCFMTATPVEDEFVLEELKKVQLVEAVWEDGRDIIVASSYCQNGATRAAVELINRFITCEEKGNAYIFVNSISMIKKLVHQCSLTKDMCNVIYSKSNINSVGIKRGVLPNDREGSIPPKKINLLTSCMFEGADIYDEDGKTFIISDGVKQNTLIDISTSLQQIAGRIRNSKYWSTITHFYTESRHMDLTLEEFKEDISKEVAGSGKLIDLLNSSDSSTRETAAKAISSMYITKDSSNMFMINSNLVKLAIYNFKVTRHTYRLRTNINHEYTSNGFLVDNSTDYSEVDLSVSADPLTKLKDVVEKLKEMDNANVIDMLSEDNLEYKKYWFNRYPFLKDAIDRIGYDGIESQGYVITNIKRSMISQVGGNEDTNIARMLGTYGTIGVGKFVAAKDLKTVLGKVYKELKIKKTPKGSDIDKYYNTSNITKRVDGKNVRGLLITGQKFVFREG